MKNNKIRRLDHSMNSSMAKRAKNTELDYPVDVLKEKVLELRYEEDNIRKELTKPGWPTGAIEIMKNGQNLRRLRIAQLRRGIKIIQEEGKVEKE